MSTNDKYKSYSLTDIQKYLRGDMPPGEMQALEAAALEDPFLADALEGMEKDRSLRGEAAFGEDLALLKDKLAIRVAEKKSVVLMPLYRPVWKIAAAVILLASVGAITYHYVFKGHRSTPALANTILEKKIAPPDSFKAGRPQPGATELKDSDAFALASSQNDKEPAEREIAGKKEETEKTRRENESRSTKTVAAESRYSAAAPIAGRSREDATSAVLDSSLFEAALTSDSGAMAKNKTNELGAGWKTNPFLIGKVTDGNNNPIPLITISIKGRTRAIKTDNNGLFRVQMLGSDSSTHITIGSTGYESVELPAYALADASPDGSMANTIHLQSQVEGYTARSYAITKKATSEKDLAGNPNYKVSSSPPAPQKALVQQAAPISGWSVYKSYLEKNKEDRSIDSTRKGMEVISFKVNKKGKLSSFKIEQSLSPSHDSLLLRLIRHGSAWKPLLGNDGSATIILSY